MLKLLSSLCPSPPCPHRNNSPPPPGPSSRSLCTLCSCLHLGAGYKAVGLHLLCAGAPSSRGAATAAPQLLPLACEQPRALSPSALGWGCHSYAICHGSGCFPMCKPFTQGSWHVGIYATCSCCVWLANNVWGFLVRGVYWGVLIQGCLHDAPWLYANMPLHNPPTKPTIHRVPQQAAAFLAS